LGVKFDKAGNLWVADLRAGTSGELLRYSFDQLAAGNGLNPSLRVASSSLNQPEAVVFDASDNLWTVNCGNSTLQMFAASDLAGFGTIKPVPRVTLGPARINTPGASTQNLGCREGIALDSSGGLWVANYYSDNLGSLIRFPPQQLAKSGNPIPQVFINSTATGSNFSRPFLIGFGPAVP
jgi:hypothetical protein